MIRITTLITILFITVLAMENIVLTKNNQIATKHNDGLITLDGFSNFTDTQKEKIIQLKTTY